MRRAPPGTCAAYAWTESRASSGSNNGGTSWPDRTSSATPTTCDTKIKLLKYRIVPTLNKEHNIQKYIFLILLDQLKKIAVRSFF